MARKVIIILLTLAAATTGVLSLLSMVRPIMWESTSSSQWFSVCVNKTQGTVTQFVVNDPVLLHDLADSRRWSLREYAYPELHIIWRKKSHVGSDSYLVKHFHQTCITVPLLLLLVVFLLYPIVALIKSSLRWRRMRRCQRGLCVKCGYNLTGNESGVCPECGDRIREGDDSRKTVFKGR